jgi:Terpene synthase family 2, C-terminal metal binding
MLDRVFPAPALQRPVGAVLETAATAFAIPPLHCPFPAVPCHPAVNALIEHTLEWASTRGLLPDEPEAAVKARSHGMLAARCYPTASYVRLAIISDFINWLLSDDACENLSLNGASPQEVHAFLKQIYAVIGLPDTQREEGFSGAEPFQEALREIWSRIVQASIPQWRNRFTRHVANYIEGCVWEASNRHVGQMPSRAVYQSMRSHTSGMYLFWDFIEFAGDFLLPDAVVEHPMVAELARTANIVVAFVNDIFSLPKESSKGDIHNIVLVLQQEESLTREEACLRAVELHDAHVRHYCALETLLPSFGAQIEQHLARYCEGLRIWMRANYDWSTVTPRYNAVEAT